MSSIALNRTTGPQVIKLFDSCFKRGVLDSAAMDDDYAVRDWYERHIADWSYGLVYDDDDFDWKRWRFTLTKWCREDRLGSVGDNYIDGPGLRTYNKNFLFAVIPLTMRFYLMGVEEWLEYPNPISLELFRHTRKIHWKPVAEHMKVMKTSDFRSYMQDFIYERQRMALDGDLSASQYDGFSIAMYKFTTKFDASEYLETEKDI